MSFAAIAGAKLQEPPPDRFVGKVNATLGQHLLDVTKRRREAGVEPDAFSDDLGREPVALEGKLTHGLGRRELNLRI